jgi:hypothetical protein
MPSEDALVEILRPQKDGDGSPSTSSAKKKGKRFKV